MPLGVSKYRGSANTIRRGASGRPINATYDSSQKRKGSLKWMKVLKDRNYHRPNKSAEKLSRNIPKICKAIRTRA